MRERRVRGVSSFLETAPLHIQRARTHLRLRCGWARCPLDSPCAPCIMRYPAPAHLAPSVCQEQALLRIADAGAMQALRNGTPTPGSALVGRIDQRDAAVYLSRREELDEELHDPG